MKMFLISDNVDTLTGMRLAGVEGCADSAVGILGGQDLHIQAVQGKGIYLYLFGELRDGDLQGPIRGNLGGWSLFAAAGGEHRHQKQNGNGNTKQFFHP